MPLPPALLERLKRRKIIQPDSAEASSRPKDGAPAATVAASTSANLARLHSNARNNSTTSHKRDKKEVENENEEEIIAEDYDDDDDDDDEQTGSKLDDESDDHGSESDSQVLGTKATGRSEELLSQSEDSSEPDRPSSASRREADDDQLKPLVGEDDYKSLLGCPNKYNIYHTCSQYCKDQHSQIEQAFVDPSMKQRKQLALLLKAYPMSNDWTPVYDPGLKTFYFWNMITNHVSWLPPGMSGFASPSADQIRKSYIEAISNQEPIDQADLD